MLHRLSIHLAATLASALLIGSTTLSGYAAPRFNQVTRFNTRGAVAEIVAASPDGKTLAFTDSEEQSIGFINITNPGNPSLIGRTSMARFGEPTSVGITPNGQYAIVAVKDDPNPGILVFINLATRQIAGRLTLEGVGPDSLAITPNGEKVVVAIESEGDNPPEAKRPPGALNIVRINYTNPGQSTVKRVAVNLFGLPGINFVRDPQPEFVTINPAGTIAAITLQENNGIALLDLSTDKIIRIFTAGTTKHLADTQDDGRIRFVDNFKGRREPDGIAFSPDGKFLFTANEGDTELTTFRDGVWSGGRSWSGFNLRGRVVYDSGDTLEKAIARLGSYDDTRSEDRGCEFEGVAAAQFGTFNAAFVISERCNAIAAYNINDPTKPRLIELKPTGDSPEGVIAIPGRNLVITANEEDGTIGIYRFQP